MVKSGNQRFSETNIKKPANHLFKKSTFLRRLVELFVRRARRLRLQFVATDIKRRETVHFCHPATAKPAGIYRLNKCGAAPLRRICLWHSATRLNRGAYDPYSYVRDSKARDSTFCA
jgi:hypothetical protein